MLLTADDTTSKIMLHSSSINITKYYHITAMLDYVFPPVIPRCLEYAQICRPLRRYMPVQVRKSAQIYFHQDRPHSQTPLKK